MEKNCAASPGDEHNYVVSRPHIIRNERPARMCRCPNSGVIWSRSQGVGEQFESSTSFGAETRARLTEVKRRLLDVIHHGPPQGFTRLDASGLCKTVCSCPAPLRIDRVQKVSCKPCGRDQRRYIDRLQSISPCSAGIKSLFELSNDGSFRPFPPLTAPPKLLISAVGPFEQAKKMENAAGRSCSNCRCRISQLSEHLGFGCGVVLNNQLDRCASDPPPQPCPARPLQQIFPGAFSERELLKPGARAPPGGIVGTLEDTGTIGLHAMCIAAECFVSLVDYIFSKRSLQNSNLTEVSRFNRIRLPVNGRYVMPPDDELTFPSGSRILDAFNNFLDAYVYGACQDENEKFVLRVEEVIPPEVPATTPVGLRLIDKINELLDGLFTSTGRDPEIQRSTSAAHLTLLPSSSKPVDALRAVFESPPTRSSADSHRSFADRLEAIVPMTLSGKRSDVCHANYARDRVDYVNFDLAPLL